ncbi:MAG: D-alanine--D-alanine ligase [Oscillospiraceae bacterium]|nr:D-alanine--D-alanine ligase [Oscillospiraceae bacterium]
MKITVAVFFGGKSTEHEVSVITGLQAFAAIDRDKYAPIPLYITKDNTLYTGDAAGDIAEYSDISGLLNKSKAVTIIDRKLYEVTAKKADLRKPLASIDIALPCVHGTNVEDGALQGFLEMQGIPYAGCDVLSSAVGMDKAVQKAVLRQFADIPMLDCVAFTAKQYIENKGAVLGEVTDKIGLPAILKPMNLGSSIGIKIAKTQSDLPDAIEHALLFADRIIAERAVTNLREINCSVLGDKDSAQASECEEPLGSGEILDFNDKYKSGGKSGRGGKSSAKSGGMASLKRKIPADISPERREEIRAMAVKAFKALGCAGVARIDFLIDCDSDSVYFNEINTIPGSMSFYLWEAVGMSYPKLLDKLFTLALKREREKQNLTFSFESNILSAFKGGFGGSKSGGKS